MGLLWSTLLFGVFGGRSRNTAPCQQQYNNDDDDIDDKDDDDNNKALLTGEERVAYGTPPR